MYIANMVLHITSLLVTIAFVSAQGTTKGPTKSNLTAPTTIRPQSTSTTICNAQQFHCIVAGSIYSDDDPCIPASWRCDGEPDCEQEEDEQECCEDGQFECYNSHTAIHKCIPMDFVCDHTHDCYHMEDETNCTYPECSSEQFRCNSGQCGSASWRCNNIVDCGDESDENNILCGRLKCQADQFKCQTKCIDINLACNGNMNCGLLPNGTLDTSDEALCGVNECEMNNAGCSHTCNDLKIGYNCSCPAGLKLKADKHTCEDVNECEEFPRGCTQTCLNTNGSYSCSCVEGYTLQNNKCLRNDGIQPTLFFANRYYIRNMSLNGTFYENIISDNEHTHVCDFDAHAGYVYFGDAVINQIHRISVSTPGAKSEPLIWHELPLVEGLAVDWLTKKLYWTDSTKKSVFVAQINGTHVKTLIKDVTTRPRAIVVHPKVGYLLWTDWSIAPFIARLGMDGSGFVKIITSGLFWPNALALDPHTDKIWWADAHLDRIEFANLDGSSRHIVLENIPHAYSITLFESTMYWADWNTKKIEKADRFTGKNRTDIKETLIQPYNIHIYHPALQPLYPNPCKENNGGCTHLCLLGPAKTSGGSTVAVCACPDHFLLEADKKTCTANCSTAQFECGRSDHRCIPRRWVCDGQADCKGQEDEPNTCPVRRCPVAGTHQCGDGSCIYPLDLCDGYPDCNDDEASAYCGTRVCLPSEFRCNTGKCIPETWKCDGEADCNGEEDEKDCDIRNCTSDEFKCNNGKCIPQHYMCDFDDDCGDNSDEPRKVCITQSCAEGWGRCRTNYRCIPNLLRCDGADDCRDNSDEDLNSCPTCDPVGDFECHSGKKCIPLRWKCDGENDCDDASDEKPEICASEFKGCAEAEFQCENNRCIRGIHKCDHDNDCGDMSDEKDEMCKSHTCPSRNQFQCASGHCISNSYQCDQDRDCVDASDEAGCPTILPGGRHCSYDRFDCGNGVCIPLTWICDGENDCGNKKDEDLNVCRNISCEGATHYRCSNGRCIYSYRTCDNVDDCGDASDENNFTLCSKQPQCTAFQYRCANRKCIPDDNVCDLYNDCGDSSDETGCHKHNRSSACGVDNGGCAHNCTTIIRGNYTGHVCHCAPGYQPNPNNKTDCIDINECEIWGMANCSQLCLNEKGSFHCYCQENFTREVTQGKAGPVVHCKPMTSSVQKLIISIEGSIRQIYPEQNAISDAVQGASKIHKIALDTDKGVMYWTSPVEKGVYRAYVPEKGTLTSSVRVLPEPNILRYPDGIAFDWLGRNLYLTDKDRGSIFVMKDDGRYMKTLIDSPERNPSSIAVSPDRGLMYWTDDQAPAKIEVAHMDGSNVQTLISERLGSPTGIAVDHFMDGRLFWCDNKHNVIESANYDGTDRQIVIGHGLRAPLSIDVLHDYIYWISGATSRVAYMDKFGRGVNRTIEDPLQVFPRDVKAYHALTHPQVSDPCETLRCWPLCLVIPGGAVCACPDGSSFINATHCDTARVPERDLPILCNCMNYHQCKRENGKAVCLCGPGYTGEKCESVLPLDPQRVYGSRVSVAAVLVPIFVVFMLAMGVTMLLFFLNRRGYFSRKSGQGEFRPGPAGPHANGYPTHDGISNPNYGEPMTVEYSVEADSTRFSNPMYDNFNHVPVEGTADGESSSDHTYTTMEENHKHNKNT